MKIHEKSMKTSSKRRFQGEKSSKASSSSPPTRSKPRVLDADLHVATVQQHLTHPGLQWQLGGLQALEDALRAVADHHTHAVPQSQAILPTL